MNQIKIQGVCTCVPQFSYVVNFSSIIVMSLGRLFGGAMKKIQLHMVRLNHILA